LTHRHAYSLADPRPESRGTAADYDFADRRPVVGSNAGGTMAKPIADPVVDMLGSIDIFRGLERKHLALIRQAARDHRFKPGETIVAEGGTDKRLYVLLSGHAEVSAGSSVIALLGPGRYVGEIAVFDGGDRTATVTASTDVTAISVNSVNLRALLKEHPAMSLKLIEGLCARVRAQGASPTN
jgi:CRP-like cAMP-binding protein